MLIAEDLALLLLDNESGKPLTDGTKLDNALAGALLLDLAMLGRIEVARGAGRFSAERVVVRDGSATGVALLDDALTKIAAKEGKKPRDVLGVLVKKLRGNVLAGLAEKGLVREEATRILGIFPTTRWPAVDTGREREIRMALEQVLVHETTPDERTGALISMLSAIDCVPKVVDPDRRLNRRELKQRAKQIAEQSWASGAVKKAVEAVQAATVATIAAASGGAANGGGS